jgi:hypothetical protein
MGTTHKLMDDDDNSELKSKIKALRDMAHTLARESVKCSALGNGEGARRCAWDALEADKAADELATKLEDTRP